MQGQWPQGIPVAPMPYWPGVPAGGFTPGMPMMPWPTSPWPGFAMGAPVAPPMMPMQPAAVVPAVHAGTPAPTNIPFPDNEEWAHEPPRPPTSRRTISSPERYPTPFASDSPSSDASNISRSHSLRGTGTVHQDSLRPPREWRPNFSMIKSSAVEAALSSLFRSKSLTRVGEYRHISVPCPLLIMFADTTRIPRVALHQYILHSASHPPISYDVRLCFPDGLQFAEITRPVNNWDLMRYACEPPLPVMVLVSPYFPWFVEARSSNPSGVTIYDLLYAIYTCMAMPIVQADYWNCEMDQTVREEIAAAYEIRCGADPAQRALGVRRMDYLRGRVLLRGISRLKDGTFEMKFKAPRA